jgi:nitrate reductase delta subunit
MSNFLERLAGVLTYPEADYERRVEACLALAPPSAREHVAAFAEYVRPLSTEDAQELFTRTLDLNPVCSMELGWHLFGENYDRGLLMARMRRELAAHDIPENGELPDHLTHALLLLARMEPGPAQDFAGAVVAPAVEKMLAAFAGKQNPYEFLLLAFAVRLEEQFPGIRDAAVAQQTLPILNPATAAEPAGRTHG